MSNDLPRVLSQEEAMRYDHALKVEKRLRDLIAVTRERATAFTNGEAVDDLDTHRQHDVGYILNGLASDLEALLEETEETALTSEAPSG